MWAQHCTRHLSFGHADVVGSKQELAVQVRHIDGVQVDDFNVLEATHDQIL